MIQIAGVDSHPIYELGYRSAGTRGESLTRKFCISKAYVTGLPEELAGILAMSDLQGVVRRPLDGERQNKLLGEAIATEMVALAGRGVMPPLDRVGVILAGDLYSDPLASKRGASGDVRSVWKAFAQRFRWVAGVAGNHDTFGSSAEEGAFRKGVGCHLLDGDDRILDGLKIAGLGGIIGRAGRRNRRSPESYIESMRRSLLARPDILVLHESPDHPASGFRGNPLVRAELENRPETLVVCGHCHWGSPLRHLTGGTQVLNVDGRGILLLAPGV